MENKQIIIRINQFFDCTVTFPRGGELTEKEKNIIEKVAHGDCKLDQEEQTTWERLFQEDQSV